MTIKYFGLLSIIFFSSCIPGPKDLGGGYILGYNNNILDRVIQINSPHGGINVTYYEGVNKIKRYFKNEDWIVDSYVVEAVYNNKFILINQKPVDSICECNEKCLQTKYPNNNKSYEMCENAIKNATINFFYIIDKANNILYGPISKKILNEEIVRLHVDENLINQLFK